MRMLKTMLMLGFMSCLAPPSLKLIQIRDNPAVFRERFDRGIIHQLAQKSTPGFAKEKISIQYANMQMPGLIFTQAEIDAGEIECFEFFVRAYTYIEDLYENGNIQDAGFAERRILPDLQEELHQKYMHLDPAFHDLVRGEVTQELKKYSTPKVEDDAGPRLPSMQEAQSYASSAFTWVCGFARTVRDIHQQAQDAGLIPNAAAASSAGPTQSAAQSRSHAAAQPASICV